MIERIHPDTVPPPGGRYNAAVRCGDLLFLSGQGPFDANGNRSGDTFADQVRATMANLQRVCESAGTSLTNAVKVNAYISSMNYFEEFNRVYGEHFPDVAPARTTVPVDLRGFDVEIDAVVYTGD